MSDQFLRIRRDGPVERITLNRPEVRNAFNEALVDELTRWAAAAAEPGGPRAAVLDGAGKAFCAGADVAWMTETAAYSREENLRDAGRMARMFAALDALPFPLVGRVHGAVLGGGCGLVAVCDMVAADESTMFGFTEVKLGIVPAVISPYVLAKIGRSAGRELFLTGQRFTAERALAIGLVHAVVPEAGLDAAVDAYIGEILASGPEAVAAGKHLVRTILDRTPAEALERTADIIATRRASAEGQEGLRAFLEKRRASWRAD
jgi:methylglutaconyl-CoA hydratase